MRSALLGTGRRSMTAPLKRTSESWLSRCWPVETSSSPRGYRRVTSPIIRAIPVCIGGNSPVSRKVLATSLLLPQEGILEEHGRRTHAGVNDAEAAVEDAALQDVVPPKTKRRSQRQIRPARALAARREIVGADLRPRDELVDMVAEVAVGRVVELMRQLALRALGNLETGMRRLAAEATVAPKQPHHPVASPVPALQLVPVEKIAALHAVCLVRGSRDDACQLAGQLRTDPLVGIEREDPFVARRLDPGVALRRDAGLNAVQHGRPCRPRRICRLVLWAGIDDNHLVSPRQVADAVRHLSRFVERGNDPRERGLAWHVPNSNEAVPPRAIGVARSPPDTRPPSARRCARCRIPRPPAPSRRGPRGRGNRCRTTSDRARASTRRDRAAARGGRDSRGPRAPDSRPRPTRSRGRRAPSLRAAPATTPRSARAARRASRIDRTRAAALHR